MSFPIRNASCGLLLFGAAWLTPVVVMAQSQDSAAARALFRDARKAVESKDYSTACPKFAESYRLEAAVGTLLNLADCDRWQGRVATAWSNFQRALEQLSASDSRRAAVSKVADDLEKRIPRLSVGLKSGVPEGTTIERDGVAVGKGSLGVPIPVDPGRHVVEVKAPGRQPQRYTIELGESESKSILGEPGQMVESAAPPAATSRHSERPAAVAVGEPSGPPEPVASSGRPRWPAYVLGGVGAAGLVAGIVTRVLAFGKQSTIDSHCPDRGCDSEGWDAVSSAKTLQTVSTVSLIAGTATLGGGIYWGLSSRDNDERPQAVLTPMVLPGGGALHLTRRF